MKRPTSPADRVSPMTHDPVEAVTCHNSRLNARNESYLYHLETTSWLEDRRPTTPRADCMESATWPARKEFTLSKRIGRVLEAFEAFVLGVVFGHVKPSTPRPEELPRPCPTCDQVVPDLRRPCPSCGGCGVVFPIREEMNNGK